MIEPDRDPRGIATGDVTVDAEALAPKLGLAPEALRENMAKGLVTGVVETGEGADRGRTRLTFRYRTRFWRVVIEPDGSLREDPVPARGMRAGRNLFNLIEMARDQS